MNLLIEFGPLIISLIFTLVIVVFVWNILKNDHKQELVFDIILITVISGFLTSRVVTILIQSDIKSRTVVDKFLEILDLNDLNNLYIASLVGISAAVYLYTKVKQLDYSRILDAVIISLTHSLLVLTILQLVYQAMNGNNIFEAKSVDQLSQFSGNIIALLLYLILLAVYYGQKNFFRINEGLLSGIYVCVIGFIDLAARYLGTNYQAQVLGVFDYIQIVDLIIVFIGVVFLVDRITGEDQVKQQTRKKLAMKNTAIDSRNKYSVSMSPKIDSYAVELTLKEKLRKSYNSYRRMFKK